MFSDASIDKCLNGSDVFVVNIFLEYNLSEELHSQSSKLRVSFFVSLERSTLKSQNTCQHGKQTDIYENEYISSKVSKEDGFNHVVCGKLGIQNILKKRLTFVWDLKC